jgi:hypothetical protein
VDYVLIIDLIDGKFKILIAIRSDEFQISDVY